MPKRGERVAPPPEAGAWELRYASSEAADGWEKLCANIPTAASACWHALSDAPLAYAERRKQLRDEFAIRIVGGNSLPQWQFEITGGGRVWYCPDEARRRVWITEVALGHPSRTDKRKGAG